MRKSPWCSSIDGATPQDGAPICHFCDKEPLSTVCISHTKKIKSHPQVTPDAKFHKIWEFQHVLNRATNYPAFTAPEPQATIIFDFKAQFETRLPSPRGRRIQPRQWRLLITTPGRCNSQNMAPRGIETTIFFRERLDYVGITCRESMRILTHRTVLPLPALQLSFVQLYTRTLLTGMAALQRGIGVLHPFSNVLLDLIFIDLQKAKQVR